MRGLLETAQNWNTVEEKQTTNKQGTQTLETLPDRCNTHTFHAMVSQSSPILADAQALGLHAACKSTHPNPADLIFLVKCLSNLTI